MKIIISLEEGKWLVNGKPFSKLEEQEKIHLNNFFKQMKKNGK
jgi:hypothetical protein